MRWLVWSGNKGNRLSVASLRRGLPLLRTLPLALRLGSRRAHDGRGLRLGDLAPTDARLAWAQRCAPVIMQPELDITLGFGLRRAFFDFREDRTCEVSLVYNGEASYQHSDPLSYNRVATFFYRSFVRPLPSPCPLP